MRTVYDYQRHAHECELLAQTAISDEQRQMILKMAETWRMLAQQRERRLIAQAKIEAIEAGLSIVRSEAAGQSTESTAIRK